MFLDFYFVRNGEIDFSNPPLELKLHACQETQAIGILYFI